MKVLFMANIPSPYRVDFFNEIGKYCDLTVTFEGRTATDRDEKWRAAESKNFKAQFMKGIRTKSDQFLCLEIIKVIKSGFDRIIVGGYSTPTAMLAIEYMRLHKIPFWIEADGGLISQDSPLKSSSAVAFYDQAEKIVKIPLAFITVLSTVMMPRLASQFADDNTVQVKRYLSQTILFSSMLAFPMMFGIAGIAASLIPWYLGPEFIPVAQAIWVLSPIVVLCSLVGISGDQYLVATNQTHVMTISYFVAAIANVLVDAMLIPQYGIVGAAIGTIVAYGISLIVQYKVLLKNIDLKGAMFKSGRYFLKAIPMFVVVAVMDLKMPATWTTTILQIGIGTVVYGMTLIFCKDEMLAMLLKKLQLLVLHEKTANGRK